MWGRALQGARHGPASRAVRARAPVSGSGSPARADRARVRAAQVELLRESQPSIVGGTLAGGALITGFLAWMTPHNATVLGWFAGLVALSALRALYTLHLGRVPTGASNVEERVRTLTVLAGASASLFGALGWWAAGSADPMVILVVVMLLTGLVASGVGFISHLSTMFLPYVALLMLPAAGRFALHDTDGLRWLAALIVVYLLVSVVTARATARAVRHSLRLRFENVDLVERLGGEIRRADEARDEAMRASRAKSVFLGAASHDLRQPLHSLRLLSTTLEARVGRPRAPDDDGAAERALVRRMDESVRALEELFDSILDVSRLDAGTLEANVAPVALEPVLERLRDQFAPLAHLRGLAFSVARGTGVVVETDPVLLGRALGNLVANALRYTSSGAVRVTVGSDASGRVRIAVADTGMGIPESEREHVFQEFVQLGNPERDRSRGIGLGLSIVRRLAGLLDIEIELDSRVGRGTRFVLGVPGARLAEPVGAELGSPRAAPTTAPAPDVAALAGLVVLVVDDEREVREATSTLLESWSCTALGASSTAAALEALDAAGRAPDVIVSDYRLRGEETGIDAIEALRARFGRAVPAVLVTGDVTAERLVEMRESGVPVLHKPCAPEALAALLAELAPAQSPVRDGTPSAPPAPSTGPRGGP